MKADTARLSDMLEAIEKIRGFTSSGRAAFFAQPTVNESVAFETLKLGEASARVSASFRRAHPGVPWRRLVELRNQLIYECFRLNLDDLWGFVSKEMIDLERELRNAATSSR
jgi:uncharacterized protein with HEPN domain